MKCPQCGAEVNTNYKFRGKSGTMASWFGKTLVILSLLLLVPPLGILLVWIVDPKPRIFSKAIIRAVFTMASAGLLVLYLSYAEQMILPSLPRYATETKKNQSASTQIETRKDCLRNYSDAVENDKAGDASERPNNSLQAGGRGSIDGPAWVKMIGGLCDVWGAEKNEFQQGREMVLD